ncbi:MAG: glycerate kinase [Pirellulaceae bacterium]|nr:MAG: glycerate kinase [Pirellulaceae bacterium]
MVEPGRLTICDHSLSIDHWRRLVLVGGGKAAASMGLAALRWLVAPLQEQHPGTPVGGWLNCPADTIPSAPHPSTVTFHAARPPGSNEPTEEVVFGTEQILRLVGECDAHDLVVCLLSGGGSALLCAPAPGLTWQDKQLVARKLSLAGADIHQLNTVRRALSRVKAGGLARACRAGRMVSLILSDVLGDDLAMIASGPTVLSPAPSPAAALQILTEFDLVDDKELDRVVRYLQHTSRHATMSPQQAAQADCRVDNLILANNADAVDAAGARAVELHYQYCMQASTRPEGEVHAVARSAAKSILQMVGQSEVNCWISGGEPTVRIPSSVVSPCGGRNQHLALAIMDELVRAGWPHWETDRKLTVVCGGTDGEDGPTDAAGAWFDASVWNRSQELGLSIAAHLQNFQSYSFFQACGGLLRTGPTGTNVCDVRVATYR